MHRKKNTHRLINRQKILNFVLEKSTIKGHTHIFF